MVISMLCLSATSSLHRRTFVASMLPNIWTSWWADHLRQQRMWYANIFFYWNILICTGSDHDLIYLASANRWNGTAPDQASNDPLGACRVYCSTCAQTRRRVPLWMRVQMWEKLCERLVDCSNCNTCHMHARNFLLDACHARIKLVVVLHNVYIVSATSGAHCDFWLIS